MNFQELIQGLPDGGIPFYNEDLSVFQGFGADAFKAYLDAMLLEANTGFSYTKATIDGHAYNTNQYGLIISGGEVSNAIFNGTDTTFDVSGGVAYIDGKFCTFSGSTGLNNSNFNYLAIDETPTYTTRKTKGDGLSVNVFAEYKATIHVRDTAGTPTDVTPWAVQFCTWDVDKNNLNYSDSPSRYRYVKKRATPLGDVWFTDDPSGNFFPLNTSFGKERFHGYYLANGLNGTKDYSSLATTTGGTILQRS